VSRLAASMHMSTQAEYLSGVAILCASLLLRAVSLVSPVGMFRDVTGVFAVLFLFAGVAVLAVGFVHSMLRNRDPERPDVTSPMSSGTTLAMGAVVGVAFGCTIGAMYDGALPVALGTAIGAGVGVAAAYRWLEREHLPH